MVIGTLGLALSLGHLGASKSGAHVGVTHQSEGGGDGGQSQQKDEGGSHFGSGWYGFVKLRVDWLFGVISTGKGQFLIYQKSCHL